MNYSQILPILSRIPADRQGAKRHYGVHPYFTRRPYNVIKKYITHYTNPGDKVLDPFGGSGVTAIEAFLENRHGIHNDINPLANFIVEGIYELRNVDTEGLNSAFSTLEKNCLKTIEEVNEKAPASIENYVSKYEFPPNIMLPSNSDVERYYDLFSPSQLIILAVLKREIDNISDHSVKYAFLLAWSAALGKLNNTFISAKGRAESRGGSSIFSIYRYKVAANPVNLDPWSCFHDRFINVMRAHKEIKNIIETRQFTQEWSGEMTILNKDVEELVPLYHDSIDYILTDPPYGGNISYLDLSTLWNNWLGTMPDEKLIKKEIIVGGQLKLSEDYYIKRLHDSITGCFDMLKDKRWLSVIFQHWNTNYFDAILSAADDARAELKSAVSQIGDPIWSMHKKKGKDSVLAGEFILTFLKKGHATIKKREKKEADLSSLVDAILSEHTDDTIYGEYLLNMVVIRAWNYGIIESIRIDKAAFAELLNEKGWHYDKQKHYWSRNSKLYDEQNEFEFEAKRI